MRTLLSQQRLHCRHRTNSRQGKSPDAIFDQLSTKDIRTAVYVFAPVDIHPFVSLCLGNKKAGWDDDLIALELSVKKLAPATQGKHPARYLPAQGQSCAVLLCTQPEAFAAYTPLVTRAFTNNLDGSASNLQSLADAVDAHSHLATGTAVPSAEIPGKYLYLRTSTNRLYVWTGSAWILEG